MTNDLKDHEIFAQNAGACGANVVTAIRTLDTHVRNEVRRCQHANDAPDMARCQVITRREIENIERAFKDLNQAFTKLKELDYPQILEKSGLANVSLEDLGFTVSVQVRTKASVAAGKKEEAIAFMRADQDALYAIIGEESGFDGEGAERALRLGGRTKLADEVKDNKFDLPMKRRLEIADEIRSTTDGLESIVVDHIFPQTLSSLAKTMAEEGKELPEEYFTTYLQTTTTQRKLPKK